MRNQFSNKKTNFHSKIVNFQFSISKRINRSRRSMTGFSLVEMLVVILVFGILGIVSTQVIVLSLRGTRKSESVSTVKENVEYAVSTMERLLRNAQDFNCITSCGAPSCSGIRLNYTDEYGTSNTRFLCQAGVDSYIASSSGTTTTRLTSQEISIPNCVIFTCTDGVGVPDSVTITLTARHRNVTGVEGAQVTTTTRINLRSY